MLARRDFVYKRSHHGANLAARDSPKALSTVALAANTPTTPPAAPSTSAANPVKTSDIPNQPTPVQTTPSTPAPSPTSSAQSPDSSASVQAPSNAASPSLVSSQPSAPASASKTSVPDSSSLTPTATGSAASTPATLGSTPTTALASVSNRLPSGTSFAPAPTLSPSTTSSPGSSGGTSTGAVVGGVAGTLLGLAVLGFLVMWCIRRQRNRDVDDFDARAFKRQSAVLVDDPVDPHQSHNPRPPTMFERHNASPALAAQAGYGGQNFYGNYGGYGQQPYGPSEMIQSPSSPPPQAYGAPPMAFAGYNDPQQQMSGHPSPVGYPGQQSLSRQPSNAAYLTRQPSSTAGYPHSVDPHARYIDLNRSSVSPYQATQYADISRQLGTTNPNGQVPPVPHQASDLPDDPLPSPFDDPAEATPAPNVAPPHADVDHSSNAATPIPAFTNPAPQTQGNMAEAHQRPGTVYNEGDAYGGI